jgi:hypothetical protein
MLTIDDILYICGLVWLFSMFAYAVKIGLEKLWK